MAGQPVEFQKEGAEVREKSTKYEKKNQTDRKERERNEINSLGQWKNSLYPLLNIVSGRSKIYSKCSIQSMIILKGLCIYLIFGFIQKEEFVILLFSKTGMWMSVSFWSWLFIYADEPKIIFRFILFLYFFSLSCPHSNRHRRAVMIWEHSAGLGMEGGN